MAEPCRQEPCWLSDRPGSDPRSCGPVTRRETAVAPAWLRPTPPQVGGLHRSILRGQRPRRRPVAGRLRRPSLPSCGPSLRRRRERSAWPRSRQRMTASALAWLRYTGSNATDGGPTRSWRIPRCPATAAAGTARAPPTTHTRPLSGDVGRFAGLSVVPDAAGQLPDSGTTAAPSKPGSVSAPPSPRRGHPDSIAGPCDRHECTADQVPRSAIRFPGPSHGAGPGTRLL